jgi:hypothetical protein
MRSPTRSNGRRSSSAAREQSRAALRQGTEIQTVDVLKFIGWMIGVPIVLYYFMEPDLTLQTPDQKLLALVLGVAGIAVAIIHREK